MAYGFYTTEFLTPPYTLPGGQQICEGTPFKSNLQSFHAMRPLLLEDLWKGFSHAPDLLEVYGAMCRHLTHGANPGFEIARSMELEVELVRVKKELAEDQLVNVLLNIEKKRLIDDSLGLQRKLEEVTAQWDKLSFVKKYKAKYPDLRSNYKVFQEGYEPSCLKGSPWVPPPMMMSMPKMKPLLPAKLPLRTSHFPTSTFALTFLHLFKCCFII
ncbi:hypothetical protein LIER_31777 [Lithospermum erythrorhizon]|uniref:Uncharacterized protein n=1 Tax=Lithospermum erythrorhizon TaxID=34254 RepID=A0AAV3RVL2_LITER